MELAGVILAGGNGKRVGFDKARLLVHGQPVLLHLARILSSFTSEIVVAIGKKRDLDLPPGVRVVEDLFPGLGPLSGLHAGLTYASFPICLIVACDAPFISLKLLARLSQEAQLAKPVIFSVRGFLEPFPGLYPNPLLPIVEEALRSGRLGMQDLLKSAQAKVLSEGEARQVDPALSSFVNINTPEDLWQCGA